jgi:hypothetical protein
MDCVEISDINSDTLKVRVYVLYVNKKFESQVCSYF